MEIINCNRNCNKCKSLNIRTDDKGYPFGYDCLKYNNSVFRKDFKNTKEFANYIIELDKSITSLSKVENEAKTNKQIEGLIKRAK